MIGGPENQQIWPSARHNGEAELPVDVFEERSSFFSVSTSTASTHRRIYDASCRATPPSRVANEEANAAAKTR